MTQGCLLLLEILTVHLCAFREKNSQIRSQAQFPDEIFLLERACDDQNMAAELPESCSFGNCCFGFQLSLFLTLLLGVAGGGKCSCLGLGFRV